MGSIAERMQNESLGCIYEFELSKELKEEIEEIKSEFPRCIIIDNETKEVIYDFKKVDEVK